MPDFSSLANIITFLQSITSDIIAIGLTVTVSLIVISRSWRVSMVALLGQTLLFGLVLQRIVPQAAVWLVLSISTIAYLIMLLSIQQVNRLTRQVVYSDTKQSFWRRLTELFVDSTEQPDKATDLSLRGTLGLFSLVMALTLTDFTVSTALFDFCVIWLILMGTAGAVLAKQPLSIGQGGLLLLHGCLLYHALLNEGGEIPLGLWGVATLLTALVTGYFIVNRELRVVQQGRGMLPR